MVQINFAQKSVTVKIVYYGPGMSGKTTNLEIVHQRAPEGNKGDLTSISTDGDRTLFFDFMPLDLGTVAGMRTQFQIYTVPGQVYYNSTRKLVLQGVDGVIFVADSGASMLEENLESLANLAENLHEYGKDIEEIPVVIQYNKRDLPDAMSLGDLERQLNPRGWPSFEAIANSGQGVFPTLKALAARVLDSIHEQTGGSSASSPRPRQMPAPAAAQPQPMAAPAPPPMAAPHFQAPPAAPAPAAAQPYPPAPTPAPLQLSPQPTREPEPVAHAPAAQHAPVQHAAPAPPQFQAPAPPQQPFAPPAMQQQAPPIPMSNSPVAPGPVPPAPVPVAPMGTGYSGGQGQQHADQPQLRMAPPTPHRAPESVARPAAPQAPAARPAPPPRSAPAPRPAAQAPAGRLRPRGPAPAVAPSPSSGGGRTAVVTAVIVIVALVAGIAIGGIVFNMI